MAQRATERAARPAGGGSAEEPVERTGERTVELVGDSADNAVLLRGRVSSAPEERELPSGAVITTLRISIARARTPMTSGSRQGSDWVDCVAWSARSRRGVASWAVGDRVEVSGSLRRRFYRSGDGATTRLEVEVLGARRARDRTVD